MSSDTSEDPLRHHPHGADEPTGYGNEIRVVPDPHGGPPTVYRERPMGLNWDTLSGPARNMYAELATGDIPNRFEILVHSGLLKWAEQMKPGNPNRLPDGNPTYIQDDVIPVIKAYVNRIPQPGVAGTPIPPALPMIELEALDFLHHHQALPYQQADYADIFGDLPDGFVWHPIQTLVGIRGLDHRTLVEFRAYKHFWTIHKDDPNTKQFSTKDEPTSEVSIIRPGTKYDRDYPQIAPGGFHNMSLPPTNQQLRKELARVNKVRRNNGEPAYPPIIYVRFANNLARIMTDHSNDAYVFDADGVPRPKVIGSLQYEEYIDEDEFVSRFTDLGRVYLNRLPTIFETSGTPPQMTPRPKQQTPAPPAATAKKASTTGGNTQPKTHSKVIEVTAEFAGTGLEARIDIPSCDCPVTVKAAQMSNALASGIVSMKRSLANGPQRVHIPEVDCCSKATAKPSTPSAGSTPSVPAPSSAPTKVQLDAADLSAIDAKIKQLSLEKTNPRQLKPLSKLQGNSYNFDANSAKSAANKGTATISTSIKVGTVVRDTTAQSSNKTNTTVKANTPAAPIPTTTRSTTNDVILPELKSMISASGFFFANSQNRQKLVDDLVNERYCKEIPVIGPGAKSWITLKGEQRTNPVKLRFVDGPSIEHIKYATVISIQQTVFYYLFTGERIKKKKITADSAHGTCFLKVCSILDAGQRLVMEHDVQHHYVRTNGVAHLYDHSMNSGLIATPTEAVTIKYKLTPEEQAAYRELILETKELWKHPITCKCKGAI
ncbi:hypothetical protein TWF281_001088 [Arthrobotrys megalospora]